MNKIKLVDKTLLDDLSKNAAQSERRRANYNLHEALDDSVQRFFNAMEPDTYIPPHRHSSDDKWELFLVLRGKMLAAIFDDAGRIVERHTLTAGIDAGLEIPADTWHTLVSLEPGSIMIEIKRGPYAPTLAKDFADWAPREKDPNCAQFQEWFQHGEIGSLPPEK